VTPLLLLLVHLEWGKQARRARPPTYRTSVCSKRLPQTAGPTDRHRWCIRNSGPASLMPPGWLMSHSWLAHVC